VVPAKISATVAGAYLLFIHLVGDTVAFPLVGALSDRFGIDRAVLVLPAVAVLGGLVVLGALRTVTKDMERAVSRTVLQSEDPTDRPTADQPVER
jgi:MFS family permease